MSRRLHFALAGPADEAELRALLRDQPLPGWVTLSFEREPDYFAASAIEGERHRVLIAREGEGGPLAGLCSRAARRVFVDGEVRWLGYMGQFRTAPGWQGGARAYRLLREGFAEVARQLRQPDERDELPYDITSILADNRPARRILSADLPGLPHYRRLGGFNTLVWRTGGRTAAPTLVEACDVIESGDVVGLPAIAACLQRNYRRYDYAPVWDEAALRTAGLEAADFLVLRDGGRVHACVSLWDQRAVKQTVVRGYRRPLGTLRPLCNLAAPLLALPRLPPICTTLQQGWLAHLACDDDSHVAARQLLRAALALGAQRGLAQLMLGLADGHPLLATARGVRRHLVYRSDLYRIEWAGRPAPACHGDAPLPHPELATL